MPTVETSPALLAKGALRRLATERLEPTPENYARAYRLEAGQSAGPRAGGLPPPAQRLIERLATRAFDADGSHVGADFALAMAEGRWDLAERTLDGGPAAAGESLAALIERLLRGLERGGQGWTTARKKSGVKRVLDASRNDPRRLHQRLSQLLSAWESDAPGPLAETESAAPTSKTPASTADESATASVPSTTVPGALAPISTLATTLSACPVKVPSMAPSVPSIDAPSSEPSAPPAAPEAAGSAAAEVAPSPHWQRVVAALASALRKALDVPGSSDSGSASQSLVEALAAFEVQVAAEGATVTVSEAAEALALEAARVVGHRTHLLDELGKLTRELTASLTDLSENDSWVQGQCDAMRVKIEEGLTVRGMRAVSDLLRVTRKRHAELKAEREHAREALKSLINRMLIELGELGSRTGSFHENVGRYAAVIEQADSLESLTGVVREMVEESRTVQSLVQQAQQRLNDEHAKATDLTQRVSELESQMKRLSEEVSTDQLTQIANRRGLQAAFKVERARMERTGKPLSVGLIDIDDFKRLNDDLGHGVGDEALKSLAALVSRNLRPGDCVARYGGEEFVVLLPDTQVQDAQVVLTRLQRALTGGLFMHQEKSVFVTFSAGVTLHRADERMEDSVERADQALYEAKRQGKNRTCIG